MPPRKKTDKSGISRSKHERDTSPETSDSEVDVPVNPREARKQMLSSLQATKDLVIPKKTLDTSYANLTFF